jgi:hypothetical protein
MKTGVCGWCNKPMTRTRTPEGFPKIAWKTDGPDGGFYCVKRDDFHGERCTSEPIEGKQ